MRYSEINLKTDLPFIRLYDYQKRMYGQKENHI